jgi:hypothetical protein
MNIFFDNGGILQNTPTPKNNTLMMCSLIFVSVISIGVAITLYNENQKMNKLFKSD